MADDSIITDEMRAKIGTTLEPVVFEVEKGAIRRFAQAVEDPNPLYADDEYARKTPYGGIVCPPGFFGWPVGQTVGMETLINVVDPPLKNILNGGNEAEFYLPVHPGDVLVSYTKLADLYEKTGSAGKMLFAVFEATYKNQVDQVVAKMRYTFIFY